MTYQHKEDRLLEAIEAGNVDKVKQLITSGIGLNTVLHSKARRESATILGTAAYEGQTEIVQFLLDCKVMVNYQDPCLSRNALHWACMGGHVEAADLLLKHKIDVNCQDRDNVSPIIRASMYGNKQLVALLISHGANVNQFDRLHSSALHYASFHGKSEIVTLLIRAGCIANNPAIFGQGTPLANLVYQGDFMNCRLLVEAGYDLSEDSWIPRYAFPPDEDHPDRASHMGTYLLHEYRNPPPLTRRCKTVIRKILGGVRLNDKQEKLPIPTRLKRALSLL